MFKEALGNLGPHPAVKLIYGRLVHEDDLDSEGLTALEEGWFAQDLESLRSAPMASDLIPREIDFLLLDGGEFSTWAEFEALRDRVKGFLLLDDTRVRKNKRVEATLCSDPGWTRLASGPLRNGWSVWARSGVFSLFGLRLAGFILLARDYRAMGARLQILYRRFMTRWNAYSLQVSRHGIVPLRLRRQR